MALVITAIFTVFNALLLPFAYIFGISKLLRECFSQNSMENFCRCLGDTIEFMFLGALVLAFSVLVEPIIFAVNLFT